MKRLFTLITMFALCLYGIAAETATSLVDAYQIYVTSYANGKTGAIAELTLNMKNNNPINSWKCTLVLPQGITYVDGSAVVVPTRYPEGYNAKLSANINEDGSVSFNCTGKEGVGLSGTDGAVATITVAIASTIEPGDYTLIVKDTQLIETNAAYHPDSKSREYVWTIEQGEDVNQYIINFADSIVKQICVANWDTNHDGELNEPEAAVVTDIGTVFQSKAITSFTELHYFTGLTSISSFAFEYCSSLTSIAIPEGVTSIGKYAFDGCSSLTSIIIPNSVTIIDSKTFMNCSNLTSVTIGSNVTSIISNAFQACSRLKKTIWLPKTPPTGYGNISGAINYVANEQYAGLQNIVVYPFLNSLFEVDGIKYVPVNPSERTCDAIDCVYDESATNINISPTVSYKGVTLNVQKVQPYICYNNKFINSLYCEYNGNIESNSFYGCTSITRFVCNINGNVEQNAFKGFTNITSVECNNGGNIGNNAFSGCTGILKAICNNSGVIGDYAFYGCNNITDLTIGEEVSSIGNCAFQNCSSLQAANISNSVTSLGINAFSGCTSLKSLSLGTQLNSIGKEAFSDCTSVTQIVSKAVTPPSCGDLALRDINIWSCKLFVPEGSLNAYKEADQWKEFFFIEEGTGSDDVPEPNEKCATPTISYTNGELTFYCETEGAVCQSTIADTDISSYSSNKVQLSVTYTITAYATKVGYNNSDTATATLCWIDMTPIMEGITDDDATYMEMKAMPVLIQSLGSTISIQGAAEGTPIAVYDIEGKQYGSTIAEKDYATITTSLRPGSIAVVKIGEKAVKVAIK